MRAIDAAKIARLALVTIAALAILVYAAIAASLPDVSRLRTMAEIKPALLFASDGEVIGRVRPRNREFVPFEKIPSDLKNAKCATGFPTALSAQANSPPIRA